MLLIESIFFDIYFYKEGENMTLQYSAVGIQNESHMATSIDDYWKDLERLQTSIA